MSYHNISSIPIQDFSDIASNMNSFQDNNIRIQKQRERAEFESRLQQRQNDLQSNMKDKESKNNKDDIIDKLRKTLSKKYELSLNDYIILVDKFKLTSTNLKRDTIISLIEYLNSTSNYTNNKQSLDIDSQKIETMKIDPIDNDDFEKNLKLMEEERNKYIQQMLSTSNNNTRSNILQEQPINELKVYNSGSNHQVNNFEPDISQSEHKNIELSIKDKINTHINQEIRDDFEINSNSVVSAVNNLKEEILMINLLKNEIGGNFIININFNGKNTIDNVKRVEFVTCLMSKNLVDKNTTLKNHSIIFKIDEFDNNIYINGSETKGFCQCFLEKNSNYYSYTNKDKIFGVYTPNNSVNLNKLHLSIFDNLGVNIKNLKYTENDQLSLVLKFFIEE